MQSLFSTIAGGSVRWHDIPGVGHPVLFIHGLGCASSYDYPRIVTDPAFGGRRAILIDLPGFGYSDKPQDYDYSTTQQARVVAELIDALGLKKVDVFGHSMGGSIATELAELLGDRIDILAVSEPNFQPGGGFYSRMVVAMPEQAFIEQGYKQILATETSPWKGCLQNAVPWAVWRASRSMVDGVTPSWMDRFTALSCTKAAVYGAQSLPDEDAEALTARGIPVHIVPEAGHSMAWENPPAFAAILGQIFAQKGS
ncbi:alpha/beta hydrolase [Enterobacteriaceae bacterium 89]|nr:alpha/beta hydrolase [Enterobacteriaceae bacterium 89]